jgi:hypothetical protein
MLFMNEAAARALSAAAAASSNKSPHWIFIPLRSIKTSEFQR